MYFLLIVNSIVQANYMSTYIVLNKHSKCISCTYSTYSLPSNVDHKPRPHTIECDAPNLCKHYIVPLPIYYIFIHLLNVYFFYIVYL